MTVLLSDLPASPATDNVAAPTAAIAWAIPRRVGTAVVRNQVRRRLRAAVADEHRAAPLRAGAYVFHVDPPAAQLSYAALSATVHDLLSAARKVTA